MTPMRFCHACGEWCYIRKDTCANWQCEKFKYPRRHKERYVLRRLVRTVDEMVHRDEQLDPDNALHNVDGESRHGGGASSGGKGGGGTHGCAQGSQLDSDGGAGGTSGDSSQHGDDADSDIDQSGQDGVDQSLPCKSAANDDDHVRKDDATTTSCASNPAYIRVQVADTVKIKPDNKATVAYILQQHEAQ